MTWQVNQKNKFAAFMQRTWKRRARTSGSARPARGAARPHHGHYAIGDMMHEHVDEQDPVKAGYSTAYQHWTGFNQPYADYARTDPAGSAMPSERLFAQHQSGLRVYVRMRAGSARARINAEDTRRVMIGTMSYVTGTHNIKFGVQDSFGPVHVYSDRQGDLTETFSSGKPSTVTVSRTPSSSVQSTTTSVFVRTHGRSSG